MMTAYSSPVSVNSTRRYANHLPCPPSALPADAGSAAADGACHLLVLPVCGIQFPTVFV